MTTLTIDNTYAGGVSGAINDADAAGHDLISLQPGHYSTDTTVTADRSTNPDTWLTLRPLNGHGSVTMGKQVLNISARARVRFHNIIFSNAGPQAPAAVTTDNTVANSNLTFTPVPADEPIVRIRLRDPNLPSQTESLVATVTGRDVLVTGLGTNASSLVTTTANTMVTFLNTNVAVQPLLTASIPGAETGNGRLEGGVPWRRLSQVYVGNEVGTDTSEVEFVNCPMAQLKIYQGCDMVRMLDCEVFGRETNGFLISASAGERSCQNTVVSGCYFHDFYKADVFLIRRHDGFLIDNCLFEGIVKAESELNHVDTIQSSFGGRGLTIRNTRFLDNEGQCVFLANYPMFNTLLENNVIHQFNSEGESTQFAELSGLTVRNNTYAVSGLTFNISNAPGFEPNTDVFFYNNISNRCSIVSGGVDSSFVHKYNLVAGGTNWVADATDITASATYVSSGYPDWNYHLSPGSRGIDEGSTSVGAVPAKDLDGVARPQGGTIDMGAYER